MKTSLFAILAVMVLMLSVAMAETDSGKNEADDDLNEADDSGIDSASNVDDSDEDDVETEVEDGVTITKIKVRDRLRIANTDKDDDHDDDNSGLGNRKDARKLAERLLKARELSKERMQKAFENYEKARERYEDAKDRYEDRKEEFKDIKIKIRDRCSNQTNKTNSTACDEFQKEALEKAKQQVIEAANRIIAHFEKIKERVDSSEQMSDSIAAEIIAEIDEKIADVKKIIIEAESAGTKDEIQDAAKKLRGIWQSLLNHSRIYAGHVLLGTYDKTLARLISLEDRVKSAIEGLDGDHTELDSLFGRYQDTVDEADTNVAKAKELFRQAYSIRNTGSGNAVSIVQEAMKYLKAAKANINDAFHLLREMVKELKDLGSTLPVADTPVEVTP